MKREELTTIYAYTKKDAVEDGSQVDVSNTSEAKEAGFKIPVYMTRGVYDLCEPSEELQSWGQSLTGRLWDVLNLGSYRVRAAVRQKDNSGLYPYKVAFLKISSKTGKPYHVTRKLWIAFNAFEGFTIMFPEEY